MLLVPVLCRTFDVGLEQRQRRLPLEWSWRVTEFPADKSIGVSGGIVLLYHHVEVWLHFTRKVWGVCSLSCLIKNLAGIKTRAAFDRHLRIEISPPRPCVRDASSNLPYCLFRSQLWVPGTKRGNIVWWAYWSVLYRTGWKRRYVIFKSLLNHEVRNFIFEFNALISTPDLVSNARHSAKSEVNSWSTFGSQERFTRHKFIDLKGSGKGHA